MGFTLSNRKKKRPSPSSHFYFHFSWFWLLFHFFVFKKKKGKRVWERERRARRHRCTMRLCLIARCLFLLEMVMDTHWQTRYTRTYCSRESRQSNASKHTAKKEFDSKWKEREKKRLLRAFFLLVFQYDFRPYTGVNKPVVNRLLESEADGRHPFRTLPFAGSRPQRAAKRYKQESYYLDYLGMFLLIYIPLQREIYIAFGYCCRFFKLYTWICPAF